MIDATTQRTTYESIYEMYKGHYLGMGFDEDSASRAANKLAVKQTWDAFISLNRPKKALFNEQFPMVSNLCKEIVCPG